MRRASLPLLVIALAACAGAPRPIERGGAPPSRVEPDAPRERESTTFLLQPDLVPGAWKLSPDGRLLANVPTDGTELQIWSVEKRALLARYAFGSAVVAAPFWSPTSTTVMVHRGLSSCVFDVVHAPSQTCWPITHVGVARSADGSFLAAPDVDRVHLVDARSVEVVADAPLPEGTVAAVGDLGGKIVFRLPEGMAVWTRATGATSMHPVAREAELSHDERFLLARDDEGALLLDLDKGGEPRRVDGFARWAPSASRLAWVSQKALTLFDAVTGVEKRMVSGAFDVRFAGDERLLFIDGATHVESIDLAGGAPRDLGDVAPVGLGATWSSADGATIVVNGTTLRVMDGKTGTERAHVDAGPLRTDVAFRANGAPIAVVSEKDEPRVVDLAPGGGDVGAFPKGGKRSAFWWRGGLLSTYCSRGLIAWNPKTGAQTLFPADPLQGAPPAVGGGGRVLGVPEKGAFVVRDGEGHELLRATGGLGAIASAGDLVATWPASGRDVSIRELPGGRERGTIGGNNVVESMQWSPREPLLALLRTKPGAEPWETVLWDAREGKVVKTLPGRGVFGADGARIFLSLPKGADVLEVGTWRRVASVRRDSLGSPELTPSPDGKLLLVRGDFGDYRGMGDAVVLDLTDPKKAPIELGGAGRAEWLDAETAVLMTGFAMYRERVTAATRKPEPIELRAGYTPREFLSNGVVAVRDALGRSVLVRVADGRELWLGVAEQGDRCGLFVHDEEGLFDGEPLDRVGYRIGDDLRSARLDRSKETLDAHRSKGAFASFLGL